MDVWTETNVRAGNAVIIMPGTCFEVSRIDEGCLDSIIMEPSVQGSFSAYVYVSKSGRMSPYTDITLICSSELRLFRKREL